MSENHIIVIGISTGGPKLLRTLFLGAPKLNASILLIQHMPEWINESARKSLAATTDMEVLTAEDKATLKPATIYVAPSGVHMEIIDNRSIRLFEAPPVKFVCPSIDVAMMSLEKSKKKKAAVILTGMGKDGADGLKHIKEIGGITFAQDEASSTIYGMPKAAAATGCVDFVGTPSEIVRRLVRNFGEA